jgi:hypothetical protein
LNPYPIKPRKLEEVNMVDADYSIPLYWKPSLLITIEEQLIVKHKGCLICGSRNIQLIRREEIQDKSSMDSKIDSFIYLCNNCGAISNLRFIYKKPSQNDDPLRDVVFVYEELLESSSKSMIPDYGEFPRKMALIYDEVKSNKPSVSKRFLDLVINDINRYYREIRDRQGFDDAKKVNRLKLLLSFISLLPLEDYSYVINNLPLEIREYLVKNSIS